MTRADTSRGHAGGFMIALMAIALVILPNSAAAMRGAGDLSPRLTKLASPSLRKASSAKQARALSLAAEGPGSLARRGGRVLAYVRFDRGALSAVDSLRSAGAKVVDASGRYQTVTVATKPAQLRTIARVPGVEGVTPVLSPVTAATCPSQGSVVSEGDGQLLAAAARAANPGVDGSGVTVGILSDSFDQATEASNGGPIATKAADDVKSGDLPGVGNECPEQVTPVDVLKPEADASEASDEGRAMTQIVHDLAPLANLKFASAFNGELAFADSIGELVTAGADVLADDVFYYEEPFFQDGPVAVAVNEAVAAESTYFSAAGNDNLIDEDGHDIASWETPGFRDADSCPPAVAAKAGLNAFHCLDFNPGSQIDKTFGIRVEAGQELAVDLQWDEPWNGVDTDLDAFLLNASGGVIAESHEDNVEITQMPVEVVNWVNESGSTKTVQLVLNHFSGEAPRLKFALIENGSGVEATEYPRSSGEDVVGPTVFGHSGSAGAISMGAVFFNDSSEPEAYSSRGPVRHDFGPVEGPTPAAPITTEILSKPDLVATDCGKTTFFAAFFGGAWRFCGTSAAAPHAGAVAALMLDAKPAAEPSDIRAALLGSATPVGAYGPCAVGAGLVEAVGAVEEAIAETGAAGPVCEPPESEVNPQEAAAPGNWGSEVPPVSPVPPGGTTTTPVSPPAPEVPKPAIAPRTFFLLRPGKTVQTLHRRAKVIFRFGSNEADVSFVCRIDGGLFRPCPKRLVRRFPLGWHTIEAAARNADGIGDQTPAHYRFKVKRVR
jgi:Subtilase family